MNNKKHLERMDNIMEKLWNEVMLKEKEIADVSNYYCVTNICGKKTKDGTMRKMSTVFSEPESGQYWKVDWLMALNGIGKNKYLTQPYRVMKIMKEVSRVVVAYKKAHTLFD